MNDYQIDTVEDKLLIKRKLMELNRLHQALNALHRHKKKVHDSGGIANFYEQMFKCVDQTGTQM